MDILILERNLVPSDWKSKSEHQFRVDPAQPVISVTRRHFIRERKNEVCCVFLHGDVGDRSSKDLNWWYVVLVLTDWFEKLVPLDLNIEDLQ